MKTWSAGAHSQSFALADPGWGWEVALLRSLQRPAAVAGAGTTLLTWLIGNLNTCSLPLFYIFNTNYLLSTLHVPGNVLDTKKRKTDMSLPR